MSQIEQQISDFIMTNGGAHEPVAPEHDVVTGFARELARASGVEQFEDQPEAGIFYNYRDNVSHIYDTVLPASTAGSIERYPFKHTTVTRVGDMTIRCIGLNREADFCETSQLLGYGNRLVVVTRPIEANHAAVPAAIYGESNEATNYLSSLSHTMRGCVVEPAAFARLEGQIESADETLHGLNSASQATTMDDLPNGSREVSLRQIADLASTAASEGRQLYSDTGGMVVDISKSLLRRYQTGIDERARYLADTYGHDIRDAKRQIESDPRLQELLTRVVKGINLLQIGSQDNPEAVPGVVLCPDELFDVVLPIFSKHESDLPDEMARNSEYRIRMMHFQGRLLLLGPSPLPEHSYLHVLNDQEGV